MLAMRLVLTGVTPYAAAKRAQVALPTMYRSRLYKLWLHGDKEQLKIAMDYERPVKRAKVHKSVKRSMAAS
jgi:hypothetical protein